MSVTDDQFAIAMELVDGRRTRPKDTKLYPYRCVPFDELRPGTTSSFLVEGVIPQFGLVAVWGPPKCGKSFWTFDLVLHIALGWKYRGRRVNGGPVAYIAFEGAEGFKARAEAFRLTHKITGKVPFFFIGTSAKLVRDHQALIASIDGQMNAPPMAVVLDTLNRSIDGSESKDQDMGAYLAAAETIVQAFDCIVIIVHHCGVDGSRPRGHTSLTGAVDSQIAVRRDGANNIIAEVEAMKDAAEVARFSSALKVVEVGTDEDGQPMTSCVIVQAEGDGGAAARSSNRPRPTGAAKVALNALREAVDDLGTPAPASNHIPPGIKVVSVDHWRDYAYRRGISPSDKPRARQAAFQRAVQSLCAAGLVGIWEPHAWPA